MYPVSKHIDESSPVVILNNSNKKNRNTSRIKPARKRQTQQQQQSFKLFLVLVAFVGTMKGSSPHTVAAWLSTSNQKRLLLSSTRSIHNTGKLTSTLKQKQQGLIMAADSRELRYLSVVPPASTSKETVGMATATATASKTASTTTTAAAQSRSVPSFIEELSNSYARIVANNNNNNNNSNNNNNNHQTPSVSSAMVSSMEAMEGLLSPFLSQKIRKPVPPESVECVQEPTTTTTKNTSNNNKSTVIWSSSVRRRSSNVATTRQEDTLVFQTLATTTAAAAGAFQQTHSSTTTTTTTTTRFYSSASSDGSSEASATSSSSSSFSRPLKHGYGPSIELTEEERDLFQLLRRVREETHLDTTLRVAGGWVRDKLLATPEFQAYHKVFNVGGGNSNSNSQKNPDGTNRLTSKFRRQKPAPSMGRQGTKILVTSSHADADGNCQQPVDIDIALDDMLGREFADHLNEYLEAKGEETVSIGMVLKNPEKSKHLETATLNVNSFWIDFVNLRAEEYTQDSRIPDLMRIGTANEDAFRRDLTINALFYNINTGDVEDWTGRGFDDLRRGVIATPLPPLTTLLDDPLRVLRSIRFAARLRFTMDDELVAAAQDVSVTTALSQKVSRERVGGELDLMLRSPDPVGAVRLLINLNLVDCVFPLAKYIMELKGTKIPKVNGVNNNFHYQSPMTQETFNRGLELLSTTHDHLADCRWSPPIWCNKEKEAVCGATEIRLLEDDEARRLLWYAAFLTPLSHDFHKLQRQQQLLDAKNNNTKEQPSKRSQGKKANRSIVSKILVDELKRPNRDAEAIERIMKASDDFTQLIRAGCDVSATMILLSDVRIEYVPEDETFHCFMGDRRIDSCTEDDPVWEHAMEFRLLCSKAMARIGPLWRAALVLSIAKELTLVDSQSDIEYAIEGDVFDEVQEESRQGVLERFDVFATALQQMGLVGIWNENPLLDGQYIGKHVLQGIPRGPAFRDVMEEQVNWMTTHPGGSAEALEEHLKAEFPEYVEVKGNDNKKKKIKESSKS